MAKADMQKMMDKKKMMAKGGMAKKGYHKMPDGKMMKDSEHKGMKKMARGGMTEKKMARGGMTEKKMARGGMMAKGGSVKKGCDGVATKGKTKGKMV